VCVCVSTDRDRVGGLEQVDELVVVQRDDCGTAHLQQSRATPDARTRCTPTALHCCHQPVTLHVKPYAHTVIVIIIIIISL
jgi:hypothetical protein